MSSIEKLAIRGIRSFSPYEEQKIEFFKPLTMILGQNGAGKTTIIESLRTMTSGSMPPHTMGGKTFIHDPRVSNQAETKASIKLKFNTIKGRPVFAMRSFLLTNRKQKQEFKKMEQVLKAKDEKSGAEISINKNCAEMDRQVPLLMGVSNAILENVIFCHQEDTLWPFSDQANLKKIFDEIFDTTKYTKALTEMRQTAKKYTKYSKEFKQELDLKRKDFEQYAKMKFGITQYENKIKELKDIILMKQQKKDILERELRDLENSERAILKSENDINFLNIRIQEKEKESKELESRLGFTSQDFIEKERELVNLKDNYQQTMIQLQQKEGDFTRKIEELKNQILNLKLEQNKLQSELSNSIKMLEESKRVKIKLVQQIKEYCKGVNESNQLLKSEDILPFELEAEKNRLKIEKEHLQDQLNRIKKVKDDQLNEMNQAIKVEQAKEVIYQKSLFDIEKQLQHLKSNNHDISGNNLSKIEEQIGDIQKKLGEIELNLKNDFNIFIKEALPDAVLSSNDESVMHSSKGDKPSKSKSQKLQTKLNKNRQKEQQNQNKIKDLRIKINEQENDIKKEEIKKQNYIIYSELYNKYEANRVKVNMLLDSLGIEMIREKDLNKDYKGILTQVNQKCANKECLQFTIQEFQKLLAFYQKGEEQKNGQENGIQQIPLEKIKTTIDNIIKLEFQLTSTTSTIEKLIKLTKRSSSCFLCKQETIPPIISQMEQNFQPTSEIQRHKQKIEREKQTLNQMLIHFQQGCTHNNFGPTQEIQSRILELQKQLDRAQNTDPNLITQILLELDYLSKQIQKYDISTYDQNYLPKLKSDLNSLVSQMGKIEVSQQKLVKENEELQAQIREIDDRSNQLKQEYSTLQIKKYKLISKRKHETQNKGNQQQIEEEVLKLTKQKSNLEVLLYDINLKVNQLRENLEAINKQENESQQMQEIQQKIQNLGNIIDNLSQFHLQLLNGQQQIDRYFITQRQQDDQELCILNLESQVKNKERELGSDEETLRKITLLIKDQSQIEQRIVEFEKYKQLQSDLKEFHQRVIENTKIIVKKEDTLKEKKQKLDELHDAQMTCSQKTGNLQSLQDNLKSMKADLGDDKFLDIEKKLLDLELKYSMTKFMALEVNEKHDALEESMMQYHHEKMKEINKTLSDFWKITYRGNDIETIEIKSDIEKSNNARMRSYNYRIVLKTFDDTELDMRGRCSAGQKVLSSIIIRLSLAETFCANCGILALDEPTTNLDEENIEGLANALIDIIESRKNQDNFQLIIITHDEMFAEVLGRVYTEFVWKVKKDQKGYSKIEKKAIQSILK